MFLRIQLTLLRYWLFIQKHSILDAWKRSEYACVRIAPGNVLFHHNKYMVAYFEFLHDYKIICFPFNIQKNSEKLHWQYCLWKTRKGRDQSPSSLLTRYNTNAPWRETSAIQINGEHDHVFIWIPIL